MPRVDRDGFTKEGMPAASDCQGHKLVGSLHAFVYLIHIYLLSTYPVPGAGEHLGWDKNQNNKVPASWHSHP